MSVYLKSQKIIKEWVDYNNHLNMVYYILIFDSACEVMLEKFDMGSNSAKTKKRSAIVVETNTKYINEVNVLVLCNKRPVMVINKSVNDSEMLENDPV